MWRGALWGLLLLLAACGGRSQPLQVENPYAEQMAELTSNGVLAIQRERWDAAEHSFARALQAARLTGDPALITHAWYNLGMAYVAQGRLQEADGALQQAEGLAQRHQLQIEYERARLNRDLLSARQGKKARQPELYSRKMPVDIHLVSARLADLQGRLEMAGEEYKLVLSLTDKSRTGLRYRAEAHMGLALLMLRQNDRQAARDHCEKALKICRDVGLPRLAANALMLQARLADQPLVRQDSLERASGMYHALEDVEGERKALQALLQMAVEAGNAVAEKRLRAALAALGEGKKP